jgi:hypothetical protein
MKRKPKRPNDGGVCCKKCGRHIPRCDGDGCYKLMPNGAVVTISAGYGSKADMIWFGAKQFCSDECALKWAKVNLA